MGVSSKGYPPVSRSEFGSPSGIFSGKRGWLSLKFGFRFKKVELSAANSAVFSQMPGWPGVLLAPQNFRGV
jgi:hypothetical protein